MIRRASKFTKLPSCIKQPKGLVCFHSCSRNWFLQISFANVGARKLWGTRCPFVQTRLRNTSLDQQLSFYSFLSEKFPSCWSFPVSSMLLIALLQTSYQLLKLLTNVTSTLAHWLSSALTNISRPSDIRPPTKHSWLTKSGWACSSALSGFWGWELSGTWVGIWIARWTNSWTVPQITWSR